MQLVGARRGQGQRDLLHVVEVVGVAAGRAGQRIGVGRGAEPPRQPPLAGTSGHQLHVEVVDEGLGGVGGGGRVAPDQGGFQLLLPGGHGEGEDPVGTRRDSAREILAVAHRGNCPERIGLAKAVEVINFGPAQVVGAVQEHGFDQGGSWERAAVQVAVGLLQQRADTRHQRRRLRGAAFAIRHQLGLHAAVVGRATRAERTHCAAGVGGSHAQRVFRHFELPGEVGEVCQALVQTGGTGLPAGITR